MFITIKIKDKDEISRLYADGESMEEAINNAILVASEYAMKRPDRWPLQLEEMNIDYFMSGDYIRYSGDSS